MSKIVFGPVTSRRFGQSLGIDLSPESKQCNFDCLYCELKGAKPVNALQNPPKLSLIIQELQEALNKYQDLDVITLTANGEPTLYPFLGELVEEIDKIKLQTKTLILSNGASICDQKVVSALQKIDIVKLSLDCATQKCFKKIDRPLHGLNVQEIIEGMIAFRKVYDKELVLEVLVVKGVNDKVEEFEALRDVFNELKPDRIDVGTIDRPPAYDVEGVSMEKLRQLVEIFENLPVSIAYKRDYSPLLRDFSEEELLKLLSKRPQSFEDVRVSFTPKSQKKLEVLMQKNLVHVKEIAGVGFYKIKEV